MQIISKIKFEQNEIQNIIGALNVMADICNCDSVSSEVQVKADSAFNELADLICLDPEGEKAYQREGW
jgi:hypothetical protein